MELIQGAQEMLASAPGQHFPRQGLLVIFPASTPHGFHHAGGDNNVVNLYRRETSSLTSALTL